MNLPTEVFGEIVVTHTPEELGEFTTIRGYGPEELVEHLTNLDKSKIIVDLDGTETIDSEGLAALLSVRDGLVDNDGELKITTTNAVNRKILEITRLDEHLEVFDSVIDAVKSFV